MCIFPKPEAPPDPKLPPETQQMKQPDAGAVRSTTGRRTMDRIRSGTQTLLTGGAGVTAMAPTAQKTLLGQ